eukprot:scaffold40078_cov75-Cyclotella_meneghiniana.AAC.4
MGDAEVCSREYSVLTLDCICCHGVGICRCFMRMLDAGDWGERKRDECGVVLGATSANCPLKIYILSLKNKCRQTVSAY